MTDFKMEYIASGCAYLRMNSTRLDDPKLFDIYRRGFEYLKDKNRHQFGVLFNAFTESSFGEKFQKFKPYLSSIHADSGGLQIVTQGLSITDALKDDVYRTQSKYATMGMCFDEIPVGTEGRSDRNDTTGRWFLRDELEVFARQTGKNLRRQIEVYLSDGTDCKPILIAQGNDMETYQRWVEFALEEVPYDLRPYIGGVAMGAAAFGTGPMEDICRAFYYTQLPIELEHKHLHVLGVGSIRRILPYVVMMHSGLFGDTSVSYDSTTHTSGMELGLYYTADERQVKFNRTYTKFYETMFDEIKDVYPELQGKTAKDFHKCMNSSMTKYIEELGLPEEDFFMFRHAFAMRSIYNFTHHVGRLFDSKKAILDEAINHKLLQPVKALYSVRDAQDFKEWEGNFYRFVKSVRIGDSKPSSLEMFFA